MERKSFKKYKDPDFSLLAEINNIDLEEIILHLYYVNGA